MLHSFRRLVLLFIAISALAACRPTLYVPADKYLLSQNIIKSDTTILEKDKILSLVKQQPNRLILGFLPFHLTVYNIGNTGKPNRFKNWLKSIGEEPAVLDPLLTNRSRNQINLLLLQTVSSIPTSPIPPVTTSEEPGSIIRSVMVTPIA